MAGDNTVRSLLEKLTQASGSAYLRILERLYSKLFLFLIFCSGDQIFFYFAHILNGKCGYFSDGCMKV